jgi:methylamine dehydrogenase accessory protein MauD
MNVALWLSYVTLWVVVGSLTIVVYFIAREFGLLYGRLHGDVGARMTNLGPPINSVAPKLTLFDIEDQPVTIGGDRHKRLLLVFVSPGCDACQELAPSLRALALGEGRQLDVILVSRGEVIKNREFVATYKLEHIPIVLSTEAFYMYEITAAPYAVLISQEGIILLKGMVSNLAHLESLLNGAEADKSIAQSQVKPIVDSGTERLSAQSRPT